jgi:hypothetical protein
MSRKDEQLLQTVLNDNSSLRLRRAKPEPRDTSIAWRNCPPGESPAGFFFASGPRLQKNQARLNEKSRRSSRSRQSNGLSARLSARVLVFE